jgi:hypothetical protein
VSSQNEKNMVSIVMDCEDTVHGIGATRIR